MPGERSAASIGMLGKRARRAVVTTPLPEPLSMAVASGPERGDSSWTQDINSSAQGRVTYSALAAYAVEVMPQSSDDNSSDMTGELGQYERCLGSLNRRQMGLKVFWISEWKETEVEVEIMGILV